LGAAVNCADQNGSSKFSLLDSPHMIAPIHRACTLEDVDLLLDHGADINACDNEGITPLLKAFMNDQTGTLAGHLISRGAKLRGSK
jgi:ankyrin repeat protein